MPSSSTCSVSGWIRLIVLTWALSVGACRIDSPEAQLTDYLTRIARVTGVVPALPAAGHLPAYPARRDLTVATPRHTIDVAEFFELHGCDMGALVGYRNSPLGRLQGASQRLGYEMEWLAAARRCGAGEKEWLTA